MKKWHLAQLNIARMLAAIDSPQLEDFVANLDRINALADEAEGFVWRLQSESGDATAFRPFDEDVLVNMSVWEDLDSLHNYVYKTAHVEIMRRRKEWFARLREAYTVLWWIPAGHRPDMEEAKLRLNKLRSEGPGKDAFTFAHPFPAPQGDTEMQDRIYPDECPA